MARYPFKKAEFITSAAKLEQCPPVSLPEIAVVGRSNVGKSSLLNDLLRNRKLAKTSSTPGKTRLLNFFCIDEGLSLVDLPGYGYAKVPKAMRRDWGKVIGQYLEGRHQMKLVLLLIDIRRIPNELDRLCLEWAVANEKSVILVLTKVDKLNNTERAEHERAILREFGAENLHSVRYSSSKHIGREELIRLINQAVADEMECEEHAGTA